MTPRLDSLRDHGVHAGNDRRLGLLDRTDLDQHLQTTRVRRLDKGGRITPKQNHRVRAAVRRRRDLSQDRVPILIEILRRVRGEEQVQPNGRPVNPRVRSTSARISSGGIPPLAPSTPNPPALETAATSSGPAPTGNPTDNTGSRQPSKEHNGVSNETGIRAIISPLAKRGKGGHGSSERRAPGSGPPARHAESDRDSKAGHDERAGRAPQFATNRFAEPCAFALSQLSASLSPSRRRPGEGPVTGQRAAGQLISWVLR